MAYESDWSSLKDISLPDLCLAGGSIQNSSENRFCQCSQPENNSTPLFCKSLIVSSLYFLLQKCH